ncbi:MAG: adenylate kinase [Nonomuraea sp.]|nr:adenylate kinase [Nonomuraea sp.]NUP67385.1 adenylate kinase [Nonomuraea sp.]NUR93344.1 adenylate kinase [Nonomuraea sp.]NUS09444.1 adenylate kinase [Nonomuraea sp.]
MRRILVAGSSGAGKSTMARALSERLSVPYHELDALYFTGPGWQVNDGFPGQVAEIAASPAWIFDSFGYPEVRDLLWERADTVIWLDYPRRVVMPRVLRRSVRRTLLREPVFGGNRERVTEWFRRDHPAWSAWSHHASRRTEIRQRGRDPRFAPLRMIRFTSTYASAAWLSSLRPR